MHSGTAILSIGLLAAGHQVVAQLPSRTPPIEFQREFGDSGMNVGNAVVELSTGGYAVVGYGYNGARGLDGSLLRLDPAGKLLWEQKYGGSGDDYAWDLRETKDGGFLVVGFSNTGNQPANEDVWVFRTDRDGALLWERRYGGTDAEEAWALELLEDGGAVILAQTRSWGQGMEDVYLLRLTSAGDTLWTRTVGGPGVDRAFSLARGPQGLVAVGQSRDSAQSEMDVWAFGFTVDGQVRWQRRYPGMGEDTGHGVLSLGKDGFVITGYGRAADANSTDLRLIRIGLDGEPIWDRSFGGPNDDRGLMSARTLKGGLVSIGYTMTGGTDWDAVVFGTKRDGTPEWQWTLNRPGPDRGVMIVTTRDGGQILTGSFGADFQHSRLFVVKTRAGR